MLWGKLRKVICKKQNERTSEIQFLTFAPTDNGRNDKVYDSCSNCSKIVESKGMVMVEDGRKFCTLECEEEAVIKEVREVNSNQKEKFLYKSGNRILPITEEFDHLNVFSTGYSNSAFVVDVGALEMGLEVDAQFQYWKQRFNPNNTEFYFE